MDRLDLAAERAEMGRLLVAVGADDDVDARVEGVHLRALGRLDPLDEFHRSAVPAFNALIPEIETRTIATFEETEFTDGWEPDAAKLVRPSATWTYLVHDNPFGSELDRLIASVGRRLISGSR